MATQKIEKTMEITASSENVWMVLTDDFYTRQWYAEFSEGAYAETDWKVGSKVTFSDAGNSGLLGKVLVFEPQKELVVEYTGLLENGVEDFETTNAKALQGGLETYRLSNNNGLTHLQVSADMAPNMIEMMNLAWDRALEKIRMLAEMRQVQ